MKCFLITILFFIIAVVAYSQTSLPGRPNQCYKSNFSNSTYCKVFGAAPVTGHQSKNFAPPNFTSYRNDASLISIIPALKLWLLPASMPNPFMKEED